MATGYLKVFVDWRERYQKLSDAEFGRLVRAAIAYKADGVVPQLNGREDLVWDGIKIDIDMDNERYSAVCEAKSEAGRRGAEARWSNKREKPNGKDGKSHLPNGKYGQEEDKDKEKDKEKKDISSLRSEISYVADPELNAAILDFVAYRKAAKKPMTDRAISMLLTKLDSMANTTAEKVAILQQSIFRGWTGVFPIKREQSGNVFLDIAREEGIV